MVQGGTYRPSRPPRLSRMLWRTRLSRALWTMWTLWTSWTCAPCGPGICAAFGVWTDVRQQICADSNISGFYMHPNVSFGGIEYGKCGILLPSKGLYQVTYGVSVEALADVKNCGAHAKFQLVLASQNAPGSGKAVQGSAIAASSPKQLVTNTVLIQICDASYLQIQNVSTNSAGAFVPAILNGNGGTAAFITIVKLQ